MPNETLTLAPAAGSGIGKQLADRLLARTDFLGLLEDAAVAALQADMPQRWDSNAKDWAPPVPDAKTRLAALLGLMAQMEGDPVKRVIHQHLGQGGGFDFTAAIRGSPELRESMRRELDKADRQATGRATKKAVPVEAAAGPAGAF